MAVRKASFRLLAGDELLRLRGLVSNGGLGPTHWNWRPDVLRIVRLVESEFPGAQCNTYVGHPWQHWDGQSIDIWGPNGRGDPIDLKLGWRIRQRLFTLPGDPQLRHTIYIHQLWTSFGGYSYWRPNDHLGKLRHLHLTYW